MALFGPKSKKYGDLNRKSLNEINETVEKLEETLANPFAGSAPGLVPESNDDTQAKYLRGDGQWGTPAGGGGGTDDYEDLANKPAIDGKTLDKNSTTEGLGLAKVSDLPDMSEYAKKNDIPAVPTKTSDLQNDNGFLTSESDPTVPSWAKQQNPPTPATFDGEHAGLVPLPAAEDSGKFLKADGTWDAPAGGGIIIPGYYHETNITTLNEFIAVTNSLQKFHSNIPNQSVSVPMGGIAIFYVDYRYHILTSNRKLGIAPKFAMSGGSNYLTNKAKAIDSLDPSMGTHGRGFGTTALYTTTHDLSDGVLPESSWGNDISVGDALLDASKNAEIFVTAGTVTYKDHGQSEDYVNNIIEVPLHSVDFYTDSSYTDKITPELGKYYIDIPTGHFYSWNGTEFILLSNVD